MTDPEMHTISLDMEQARIVDELVRTGRFPTEGEVIRAGLEALQDREALLEVWLRDAVVPAAAAIMADPSRAIPIDTVFDEIRQMHAERSKATERGA